MSVPEDEVTSIRHDGEGGGLKAPTDHRGLRVMGFEECLERLRATPVGRLALVHAGEPLVFPVNHAVDGVDIIFRTLWGSKLRAAEDAGTVAFEVDGYDTLTETGWSVIVKGTAEMVYEDKDTDRYDRLRLRSWADTAEAGFWVRIRPIEVTGREVLAPNAAPPTV